LERRARADKSPDEALFLDDLDEIAERGTTQAEEWLKAYEGRWGGDLTRIFDEGAY
jgi:glutamate--cysteine ligase